MLPRKNADISCSLITISCLRGSIWLDGERGEIGVAPVGEGEGEGDLIDDFLGVVEVVGRAGAEGEEIRGLVDMMDEAEAEEDSEGDLDSTLPVDVLILDVDLVFTGFALDGSKTEGLSSNSFEPGAELIGTGFLVTGAELAPDVGTDAESAGIHAEEVACAGAELMGIGTKVVVSVVVVAVAFAGDSG